MYSENSKIVICLDSFSKRIYNIGVLVIFRLITFFDLTALFNLQYFPLASFARSIRVTDWAFTAETYIVWPVFCLTYEYILFSFRI